VLGASGPCEEAWGAVHEALPARWRVGPPSFDPAGDGRWSVTAVGPHPGRGKLPTYVSGSGADEIAALRDLDGRLRGVPKPDGTRMDALRARLRLAYVEGAEGWSREHTGRSLTSDELTGVLVRYQGR